jgi:hypothetical protein
MKRKYDKPSMHVVLLQYQHQLLAGSGKGYEVIGTGEPNLPAGARDFDDWDEDDF